MRQEMASNGVVRRGHIAPNSEESVNYSNQTVKMMIASWETLYGEVQELHYSHIMRGVAFLKNSFQSANRLFESLKRGFVIDGEWGARKYIKPQRRKGRKVNAKSDAFLCVDFAPFAPLRFNLILTDRRPHLGRQ